MQKCFTIEDGVKAALKIYECEPQQSWKFSPAKEGEIYDKLWIDNEEYPLLWHRCDPQIREICDLAPDREPCSMKLNYCGSKKMGLDSIMYREFDIAQQALNSKIRSIMCFRNDNVANIMATMENDCVAVFELSAALNEKTPEQGRHTLWGKKGMVSDRVISQKVTADSAYIFTEDQIAPQTYNDLFVHMYGLNRADTIKAACIAEILLGRLDISEWKKVDDECLGYLEAAGRSAKEGVRVFLESEANV